MEGRERVFFDEEAAVAQLETGYFWDKTLIIKGLFEIDKEAQKGQKEGKNVRKSGGKKNFHLGDFVVKKWGNLPFLRKQDRSKKDRFRLKPQIDKKKIGNER